MQPAAVIWARRLLEGGLFTFLILLAVGPELPNWIRLVPFLAVLLSLLVIRLGPAGNRPPTPYAGLLPMIAFVIATVIAIITSELPDQSMALIGYLPLALIVSLAVQDVLVGNRSLWRLGVSCLVIVIIITIDGLVQMLSGESLLSGVVTQGDRVRASLPHPNDLEIPVILMPLAMIPLLTGKRWLSIAAMLTVVLLVVVLIGSQSRNAWVGMAIGLVCLSALAWRPVPWRKLVICVAAVAAGGCVAYALDLGGLQDRLASFSNPMSEGRIGIWSAAWQMFLDAPLTGMGPSTFSELYLPYLHEAPLPDGYVPEISTIPWAHNLPLEMLAEYGLVGLAAFVAVITTAIVHLKRALRSPHVTARSRIAVTAVLTSWLVFLGMSMLDLTFFKDWVAIIFWLLFGLAVSMPRLVNADHASQPTPTSNI